MSEAGDRLSRLDIVRNNPKTDVARIGRLVVSMEKIVEDPQNERKIFRGMAGLTASIRKVGLVEPITVMPVEGGRYQIITGHRRFRAARDAGRSQIEVIVREPEAEIERRRKSLVSNIQREDIGPVEMAEALRQQLENDSDLKTQAALAEAIGKDESWVSAMLRILTLPKVLRDQLGTSQLSLTWESVARIARVKDAKHQARLVNALLSGATHQEIRKAIGGERGETTDVASALNDEAHTGAVPSDDASLPSHREVTTIRTSANISIVVRHEGGQDLTRESIVTALTEALDIARR